MLKSVYSVALILLLFQPHQVSAEPATVVTDATLYRSPSTQSVKQKQLAAGTAVEFNKQVGSWKQVSLIQSKSTGWVRSYQVRIGEIAVTQDNSQSSGFFGALANLSRKASGLFSSERKGYSYQRTATIGVRGLSEEQIKNAQPDFTELSKLESFREDNKTIRKFASSGRLQARKVNHIPKSEKEK
jgi:hypothetical protein